MPLPQQIGRLDDPRAPGFHSLNPSPMAITNYLPKTRQLVDKLIDFLKARPALYNQVLRVAKAHDRWMDYRKFGINNPIHSHIIICLLQA